MKRQFLGLVIGVLVWLGVGQASSVQACSYAQPPTDEQALARAAIIVHGQLVETDIARQNYVLQVDTYLAGSGPEYLLLSLNSPMIIQGIVDTRFHSENCAWLRPPLPLHKAGYFVLDQPNELGVYEVWLYQLIVFDSYFPYDLLDYDVHGYNLQAEISRDEFEALIFRLRNSSPRPPLSTGRYPTTAPLLIRTENGEEYLLKPHLRYAQRLRQPVCELYNFYSFLIRCDEAEITFLPNGWAAFFQTATEQVYARCDVGGPCDRFEFKADHYLIGSIGARSTGIVSLA
jgi:hypothetical protein